MNKILVTIYVVSVDESYDFLFPIGKTIKEIVASIQDSLIDLSNGNYQKKEQIVLYNSEGYLINQNNIVKYSGLKNGCRLIML